MNFDVKSRTIYYCVHGSRAYGTNIETSDYDFKGICVPPKDVLLGFLHRFDQQESMCSKGGESDNVIYSLQKFTSLASQCNPNIIEVLFVDDSDILQIDEFGELLRENRQLFLSQQAYHTFRGYSVSQIKRIKTHRGWLLNPPTHMPTREEYNLPEQHKISKSDMGAYDSLMERNGTIELPHDIVKLFCAEKAYASAKAYWDQYENWKKTRNPARAALEAKWGFDTKHALHVMRLLRMCKEILRDKQVIVKRPDFEELLAIRHGAWTYDKLLEEAEKLEKECDDAYKTCTLPHQPNRIQLNDLIVNIIDRYLMKYG